MALKEREGIFFFKKESASEAWRSNESKYSGLNSIPTFFLLILRISFQKSGKSPAPKTFKLFPFPTMSMFMNKTVFSAENKGSFKYSLDPISPCSLAPNPINSTERLSPVGIFERASATPSITATPEALSLAPGMIS